MFLGVNEYVGSGLPPLRPLLCAHFRISLARVSPHCSVLSAGFGLAFLGRGGARLNEPGIVVAAPVYVVAQFSIADVTYSSMTALNDFTVRGRPISLRV